MNRRTWLPAPENPHKHNGYLRRNTQLWISPSITTFRDYAMFLSEQNGEGGDTADIMPHA